MVKFTFTYIRGAWIGGFILNVKILLTERSLKMHTFTFLYEPIS